MNLSHEEVEILIIENALDTAKEHTARMKRRAYRAEAEFLEAQQHVKGLEETIQLMRDGYLSRTV